MPYMQIGLIDPDDLPPSQKAWIESQLEEVYHRLVYITDGDAGLPREIHQASESPEEIAGQICKGDRGITVTLIDEDFNKEILKLFRTLMREGDEEKKGYWGGSLDFYFSD